MNKDKLTAMKYEKLELGSGQRPTPGYLHQDITGQPGVELDFNCQIWEIPLKENSLSEIIALASMEHLNFADFSKALKHIHKLLAPGGIFLFDVPDIKIWSEYLYDIAHNMPEKSPFSQEHVFATFWGWQRWPGDEHKCAWLKDDLFRHLKEIGFSEISFEDTNIFTSRGIFRDRFKNPANAHLYIKAVK
jgi:predicted SAM-dependent methyltransferase